MSKPIQSVERAMRMLEFLARERGAAPLGAIARAAGVQSSTAHNILATLVALGYTVARPTAILELEWSRVDFERGQIDFNPLGRRQTAKRRPIVPINSELHEALKKAFEARQSAFVIERGGEPIRSIKKAFQAASDRSGIKATPYTLRHTGAVWAAEAGVSMAALAQFMGHDDDRTTQKHYARFSPDYLKDVGDRIAKGRRRR